MGDDVMYNQFISSEHGMISGCPNIVLLFAALGLLVGVIILVACLTKRQQKKKNTPKVETVDPAVKSNQVAPKQGDVIDDIGAEIDKFDEQKKKMSLYLSYLMTRDGEGLANANARRFMLATKTGKAMGDEFGEDEDYEDGEVDEEKQEYLERKRRVMVNKLNTVLGNDQKKRTKPKRPNAFM